MDVWFTREMILNAALLVSASIIFGYLFEWCWNKSRTVSVLTGVISGMVGVLLMIGTAQFNQDVMIDARTVLISITGLFFGPVPVGIAVAITCFTRVLIGGAGVVSGVLGILAAAGTGLFWHYRRYRKKGIDNKWIYLDFYLMGLVTHIFMILSFFAMPQQLALEIIRQAWFVILSVYPVGTLLCCMMILLLIKKKRTETALEENERQLKTLYEQAPIGIAILDVSRKIIYCNPMFEKIHGRSKAEINAVGWQAMIHPDNLEAARLNIRLFEEGQTGEIRHDLRGIRPDGTVFWGSLILAELKRNGRPRENSLCLVQDVTDIVEAREHLEESVERYRELYHEYKNKQALMQSLINATPDLIFYKDTHSIYRGCNRAFEQYLGIGEEYLAGLMDHEFLDEETTAIAVNTDTLAIESKGPIRFEWPLVYPDGKRTVAEMLKTPYYDEDGMLLGVVCLSRDITERKKKEDEVRYLNHHDPLTGVYNRTYLDREQKTLNTKGNLPISVILGDVDGLKLVNDAFGHSVGDRLLQDVARVMQRKCRPGDFLVRLGGDEFCIFLPRTDNDEVRQICAEIDEAIIRLSSEKEGLYVTSVSLGYATENEEAPSLDNTLRVAEEYMYRHKLLAHKGLHSTIMAYIRSTLYEKSNETEAHGERLAFWAKKLGNILDLQQHEMDMLELSASLHDIGKISIDLSILQKPGKLTMAEEAEIRKHPEAGYRIALSVPELRPIAEVILCHHEKWDGSGYPQGLAGENIPIPARIITLVDSYDAMTEERQYHRAMSQAEAAREIMASAGSHFDPALARLFVEKVLEEPVK